MILVSSCGMMFKNNPTTTKIVNNSQHPVDIIGGNADIVDKIEPNNIGSITQRHSIKIKYSDGSVCKVSRTVNAGVVMADIFASLFVPFWPISIPLIWITDTAGGTLRDNVSYVDVSTCLK